jgi:predicted GIY-YIG superfamily endonuclease
MPKPFFAYILLCADDSYYTGHTDDMENRFDQHCAGLGCTYTAERLPVRLVWRQEFASREEAKEAELQIKGWSRAKKQALIAGEGDRLRDLSKKSDWAGYQRRSKNRLLE